jgi:16S rRNA (cytosine1402-N4)-methyltransferase
VSEPSSPEPHRRRPRYAGKNPRRFEDKYKEHAALQHPETVAKVLAAGKTPAGTHRSIMVGEILEVLQPQPGQFGVDCTLGYGGHAQALLDRLQPGGRLVGIDADPIEFVRTEARLRQLGYGPEAFAAYRANFAGLPRILASEGRSEADLILADLGVSSMQLDNPVRGFSLKQDGPLDMRMNPHKGVPVSEFLEKGSAEELAAVLEENADEPRAWELANALAGRSFRTTQSLVRAVRGALQRLPAEEQGQSVRRVFQALRIAVNEEFVVLDTLLRLLPSCTALGGRIAILSFHSGEDRRVKKAFEAGLKTGIYDAIAPEVLRPSPEERRQNSRSTPAKLRWAVRSASGAAA